MTYYNISTKPKKIGEEEERNKKQMKQIGHKQHNGRLKSCYVIITINISRLAIQIKKQSLSDGFKKIQLCAIYERCTLNTETQIGSKRMENDAIFKQ